MIKLKSLNVKNVFGYRDAFFNFEGKDGIKPLSLFYGPNGCGKTSILNIINLLSAPERNRGRDTTLLFRKMAYHPEYSPTYSNYQVIQDVARAEAVFATDAGDKTVIFEYDPEKVEAVKKGTLHHREVGIIYNDLVFEPMTFDGRQYVRDSAALMTDADNAMNTSKFQLEEESAPMFLDMAKSVFNMDCKMGALAIEKDKSNGKNINIYTDFIIHKESKGTSVHYKSMSAGEKKIATLLKELCQPVNRLMYDIYLIDNWSMHIYFKRHKVLVDKFFEHFANKQLFATDHSGVLIEYVNEKFNGECSYDVENPESMNVVQPAV